ncbi:MAG TPA: GtrA family protein [Micromonosporaceae bacterium]
MRQLTWSGVNRSWHARVEPLAARLPQKWRALTHELAKFGTIGLINVFVNMGVSNLLWLTVLRGGELKAKAVAAIVATTCAYFMNRHWTYRDRPKSTLRREYSLFFFFNAVGMLIEISTVGIAKYGLHQTHVLALNFSMVVGIGLGTLFRFWAYRTHVFKPEVIIPAVIVPDRDLAASSPELDPAAGSLGLNLAAEPSAAAPAELAGRANAAERADRLGADAHSLDDQTQVSSEIDEIELDGMVTLAAEQPLRSATSA